MKIKDHIEKSRRIERSSGKFSQDTDYEMFIESCMLAGTHLLNAVLHSSGITSEHHDLLHSDKPALATAVPVRVTEMMQRLKQIEDLRSGYLRGKNPWQPSHGDLCVRNMRFLRGCADQLLNKEVTS